MRRRKNGKLVPSFASTNGYRTVALASKYGVRQRLVHQLVAEAFIGPRPDGLEVDHIDRDRMNAEATNLRYLTRAENIKNTFCVLCGEYGHPYCGNVPSRRQWSRKRFVALLVARVLAARPSPEAARAAARTVRS